MATQWSTLTRTNPRSWLLSNGEVVTEPTLEETPSGRKVRIAGTTESVYESDLERLLTSAAHRIASDRNSRVFLELTYNKYNETSALNWHQGVPKGQLHLVHSPQDKSATTTCWWRFKSSNTPFEVVLTVQLGGGYSRNDPAAMSVTTTLVMPTMRNWNHHDTNTVYVSMCDDSWTEVVRSQADEYRWREFVRDNQPGWDTSTLGGNTHNQRQAIEAFLKKVRYFESLDTLDVLDVRDPDTPAWMSMELYETNVNDNLISELVEYLDGGPSVEKALEIYQQLVDTLKSIGVHVGPVSSNDFMAALVAGHKGALNMKVTNLAGENFTPDHTHHLSAHLPSGTFVVECEQMSVDQDTVADRWEEAKTIAALTGEEDELLAYAREYAKTASKRRTEQILAERTK